MKKVIFGIIISISLAGFAQLSVPDGASISIKRTVSEDVQITSARVIKLQIEPYVGDTNTMYTVDLDLMSGDQVAGKTRVRLTKNEAISLVGGQSNYESVFGALSSAIQNLVNQSLFIN